MESELIHGSQKISHHMVSEASISRVNVDVIFHRDHRQRACCICAAFDVCLCHYRRQQVWSVTVNSLFSGQEILQGKQT